MQGMGAGAGQEGRPGQVEADAGQDMVMMARLTHMHSHTHRGPSPGPGPSPHQPKSEPGTGQHALLCTVILLDAGQSTVARAPVFVHQNTEATECRPTQKPARPAALHASTRFSRNQGLLADMPPPQELPHPAEQPPQRLTQPQPHLHRSHRLPTQHPTTHIHTHPHTHPPTGV